VKLAIFDLDGTLLCGNSWRVYLNRSLRRNPLRVPVVVWALARRALGLLDGRGLREVTLAPLIGLNVDAVRTAGAELVAARLLARIRPLARREVERCRAEGHELVLATGAFDFIAQVLAGELGVSHVICTQLEYDQDGRCAGRIRGEEMRGKAKAEAVRAMFAGQTVDWRSSCAFSDDMEDAPLFGLVGRPVFVIGAKARATRAVGQIERVNWG
jgi:putative phosphoserine phosphatase/1-acylglycerol-3-phosphate O-acyltransferase